MRMRYTPEMLDFLRREYPRQRIRELTRAFNARFGVEVEPHNLHTTLKRYHIRSGRRYIPEKAPIRYTQEQIEWLRNEYRKRPLKELTQAFNNRYGDNRNESTIKSILCRYRIRSGRTGRFKKGNRPWNEGIPGCAPKCRNSWFRPGTLPHTTRPLYSERVNSDGYILIKVPRENPKHKKTEKAEFVPKHIWIWEQHHGPVPPGHKVRFRDGNNRNFGIDNLMLVTNAEHVVLNKMQARQFPAELQDHLLAVSRLKLASTKRMKNESNH